MLQGAHHTQPTSAAVLYNPSPVSLSPARLVFIGKAEYMSGTAQTPHTEHEEYEDGIADYILYHTEHV